MDGLRAKDVFKALGTLVIWRGLDLLFRIPARRILHRRMIGTVVFLLNVCCVLGPEWMRGRASTCEVKILALTNAESAHPHQHRKIVMLDTKRRATLKSII